MEYSLVELSEITGEGERCSSTESGWTVYLASPLNNGDNLQEDDDGYVVSDVSTEFHDSTGENRVEEDDSLASDASTGNAKRNVDTTTEKHVSHGYRGNYNSLDDGLSNHSTNMKDKVKRMERREDSRCFGGLFKRGSKSSSNVVLRFGRQKLTG